MIPVLDQAGNVIGVVVSKLDALTIAKRVGDLPQNVNFAIRGEVLRGFLENNQIAFTASNDTARLENTDIAAHGASVTVRVRCVRQAAAVMPAARSATVNLNRSPSEPSPTIGDSRLQCVHELA